MIGKYLNAKMIQRLVNALNMVTVLVWVNDLEIVIDFQRFV